MIIPTSLLMKFAPYIIVGAVIFGVYVYMQHLQNKVEVLQLDNATLGIAVETQPVTIDAATETIDRWAEDREDLLNAMDKLSKVAHAARSESREVTIQLNHLGKDSLQDASIVNDLTRRLHGLLRCSSRGEDCDGELQAARVATELISTPTN